MPMCWSEFIFLITYHRRKKLFNIEGGGQNLAAANFNALGGGDCQKYIYSSVHMHMYAHTCVKYLYRHACMHMHVCTA